MKLINFVSTFEYFDLESNGLKSYTIRKLTDRLKKLSEGATHLRIQRGYTKTAMLRPITHVLDWDGNRIFAW